MKKTSYDKIHIRNLALDMLVGIHPHEKKKKQKVIVEAEVFITGPGQWVRDDIKETVSYDDLVAGIETIAAQGHFNLLETFLEKTAEDLFRAEKIITVRIAAEKPGALKNNIRANIEIFRTRK